MAKKDTEKKLDGTPITIADDDNPRLNEIKKEMLKEGQLDKPSNDRMKSLIAEAKWLGYSLSCDISGRFKGVLVKSEIYNPTFCAKCNDVTAWSHSGYCLTCSNPASKHIDKRIAQYGEWTGDKDWEYDAGEYWLLVFERMYQMVVDGHSVAEVATEFNTTKSNIYSRIRNYCKRNKLETPFKKRKRKPNGLFCFACNRPLVGNQRKWCGNDDCEGYYALHPEKKPEYIEEQQRLQQVKFAQERLDDLRNNAKNYADKYPNDKRMAARYDRWILDAETQLGILKGTIEPFHVTCSSCGKTMDTNLNPELGPDEHSEIIGWFCKEHKNKKGTLPREEEENVYRHWDRYGNIRLMDKSKLFEHVEEE